MTVSLRSFQGDAALRREVAERLLAAGLPEYLSGGPMAFGPDEFSPAGLMAQASDAALFPSALGLPRWLAYAIDEAFGGSAREASAGLLAESVAHWPLGDDLSVLAGPVVAQVITAAEAAVAGDEAKLCELRELAAQVRTLHQSVAPCQPGTEPWRGLRRAAMRSADAQDHQVAKLFGACVEAAAWGDLSSTDTTVAEVLRAWRVLRFAQIDESLGWTEAVQGRIEAVHAALERELQDRPDASADLFQQLLQERHPEEAATLRRYYGAVHEKAAALALETQHLLLNALSAR